MTVSTAEPVSDEGWREEREHCAAYLEARMNDLGLSEVTTADGAAIGVRYGYELAIQVLEGKA
jgi:hypothetical protein